MLALDEAEFARWRDEAATALAAARLQQAGAIYNWSCFLAEQAAQLAIKGLLHAIGRAPWGHDLVALCEALRDGGIAMPEDVGSRAQRLSRHYIPARYPDAHGRGSAAAHYGLGDANEATADAESFIAFVDEQWNALRAT